ncbi:hypothetical protein pb186bvf_001334 [Paramecium bursaria]
MKIILISVLLFSVFNCKRLKFTQSHNTSNYSSQVSTNLVQQQNEIQTIQINTTKEQVFMVCMQRKCKMLLQICDQNCLTLIQNCKDVSSEILSHQTCISNSYQAMQLFDCAIQKCTID